MGDPQDLDVCGTDVVAGWRHAWGGKKAAVTVAHTIVVSSDHLLLEGTFYEEERYERLWPRQEERERQRALKALERMGYAVTLEKVA